MPFAEQLRCWGVCCGVCCCAEFREPLPSLVRTIAKLAGLSHRLAIHVSCIPCAIVAHSSHWSVKPEPPHCSRCATTKSCCSDSLETGKSCCLSVCRTPCGPPGQKLGIDEESLSEFPTHKRDRLLMISGSGADMAFSTHNRFLLAKSSGGECFVWEPYEHVHVLEGGGLSENVDPVHFLMRFPLRSQWRVPILTRAACGNLGLPQGPLHIPLYLCHTTRPYSTYLWHTTRAYSTYLCHTTRAYCRENSL